MTDAERVLRMLTNADTTQADMAFVLGLPIRAIQEAILELRRTGHPVISSGDGIRLARDSEDALACAAALRRRAITQWITARELRRTARRMLEEENRREHMTLWQEIAS